VCAVVLRADRADESSGAVRPDPAAPAEQAAG
jgi:hypothetical protein